MKNLIENGVEYAVNLNGERYEVVIPGTKCPVSAEILRQWYWDKGMSLAGIHDHLKESFLVQISDATLGRIFKNSGIKTRTISQVSKMNADMDGRIRKLHLANIAKPGAPIDQLNKIRPLAIKNRILVCLKRKILKSCPVCRSPFYVPPSRKDRVTCSKSCNAKRLNDQRRQSKEYTFGLICPSCYSNKMYFTGSSCREAILLKILRCAECRKRTVRPILELGLRQDLEAAGALDDGRILASAFKSSGDEAGE